MSKYRYKFLHLVDDQIKSDNGDTVWTIGEWQHVKGKIKPCENGLHSSKQPLDALGYVYGEVLAKVEIKGTIVEQDDKEASSDMRIVKAWKWQKQDSVALSIFTAKMCLDNYEKLYPKNKAPRKAIEAAERWLAKPTEENRKKAEAAESAADSVVWLAAELAAGSAAELAAGLAAELAAESAARSAVWSAAESAAWSAAWSARSAKSARSAALKKVNKWIIEHINEMEEL